MPTWGIILTSSGIAFSAFLLLLIVLGIVANNKRNKRAIYYKGEKKDGIPHGKGTIYFNKNDPISRIESDSWKNGKINGKAKLFFKKKKGEEKEKSEEVNVQNNYLLHEYKNEDKNKNVFHILLAPDGYNFQHDYLKKYDNIIVPKLWQRDGFLKNLYNDILSNAIKTKVFKISLLGFDVSKDRMLDSNFNNIKHHIVDLAYMLNEASKELHADDFSINIVNNADYGAETWKTPDGQENLQTFLKGLAKHFPHVKIVYSSHDNPETEHHVLKTYDAQKKIIGKKHFNLAYKWIKSNGEIQSLTKVEKNQLLHGE